MSNYIYHKFDSITDICDRCELQKRIRALQLKGGTITNKKYNEYLVNNKWIKDAPECIKKN